MAHTSDLRRHSATRPRTGAGPAKSISPADDSESSVDDEADYVPPREKSNDADSDEDSDSAVDSGGRDLDEEDDVQNIITSTRKANALDSTSEEDTVDGRKRRCRRKSKLPRPQRNTEGESAKENQRPRTEKAKRIDWNTGVGAQARQYLETRYHEWLSGSREHRRSIRVQASDYVAENFSFDDRTAGDSADKWFKNTYARVRRGEIDEPGHSSSQVPEGAGNYGQLTKKDLAPCVSARLFKELPDDERRLWKEKARGERTTWPEGQCFQNQASFTRLLGTLLAQFAGFEAEQVGAVVMHVQVGMRDRDRTVIREQLTVGAREGHQPFSEFEGGPHVEEQERWKRYLAEALPPNPAVRDKRLLFAMDGAPRLPDLPDGATRDHVLSILESYFRALWDHDCPSAGPLEWSEVADRPSTFLGEKWEAAGVPTYTSLSYVKLIMLYGELSDTETRGCAFAFTRTGSVEDGQTASVVLDGTSNRSTSEDNPSAVIAASSDAMIEGLAGHGADPRTPRHGGRTVKVFPTPSPRATPSTSRHGSQTPSARGRTAGVVPSEVRLPSISEVLNAESQDHSAMAENTPAPTTMMGETVVESRNAGMEDAPTVQDHCVPEISASTLHAPSEGFRDDGEGLGAVSAPPKSRRKPVSLILPAEGRRRSTRFRTKEGAGAAVGEGGSGNSTEAGEAAPLDKSSRGDFGASESTTTDGEPASKRRKVSTKDIVGGSGGVAVTSNTVGMSPTVNGASDGGLDGTGGVTERLSGARGAPEHQDESASGAVSRGDVISEQSKGASGSKPRRGKATRGRARGPLRRSSRGKQSAQVEGGELGSGIAQVGVGGHEVSAGKRNVVQGSGGAGDDRAGGSGIAPTVTGGNEVSASKPSIARAIAGGDEGSAGGSGVAQEAGGGLPVSGGGSGVVQAGVKPSVAQAVTGGDEGSGGGNSVAQEAGGGLPVSAVGSAGGSGVVQAGVGA
ncbi:hypothetical protein C8Q79DRAFT_1005851 [Trametes meyenii]|nr:hypothetical protein C8Q79DRAFT_1005851 [Trametes meyenii]